jgi:hypothetical protein
MRDAPKIQREHQREREGLRGGKEVLIFLEASSATISREQGPNKLSLTPNPPCARTVLLWAQISSAPKAAARQGPAAGADQAPGPHSHSSASACLDDRLREAAKWLQAAFDGGHPFARLYLAHVTFYAGQEDAAPLMARATGRDTCAGCGLTRGEDTPILTCSGCRVARFCSADHQKRALKKAALGGNLLMGSTRISAECSASGARLSKTVLRLTRARRACWHSCSDECAMPRRRRGSAVTLTAYPECLTLRALAS